MPERCPSAAQLQLLIRNELANDDQSVLLKHLDGCGPCRQRLEELAGGTAWLPQGVQAGPPKPASTPQLERALESLRMEIPVIQRGNSADSQTEPLSFLTPSTKPGVIGLLENYEVLEEIARGGMGIVLKARDPSLDRIVAVKVLAPALANSAEARSRFLREARAAASITHEHVITIHAVEETRNVPYLVMQCVVGKTLAERIRMTGRLPLVEILRIGFQIASGLAAAHRLGLIHRDIKPSNILLENSVERVKITDFGLARAADDTGLTLPGHVAGTPEYMSPEQALGITVDQRTDLFSLGCVLYEMATGLSPFRAPTSLASLRKVCDEEPAPVHVVNPAIPEWLNGIIERLLKKDPALRLSSAAALAEEMGSYLARLHQPKVQLPPASAPDADRTLVLPRRSPILWPSAAAAALLVSIAAVGFFLREKQPSPQAASSAHRFVVTSIPGGPQRFATLSEAVQAAPRGAVIELQFNGELAIEPVALEGKTLALRAAPDFQPVLVNPSAQALLTTSAPLLLEGLTFKSTAAAPDGPPPAEQAAARPMPGDRLRREPAVMFIQSAGPALMVANCQFLITARPSAEMPKGPTAIRMTSPVQGHLENCAFLGATGRAMEYRWEAGHDQTRFSIRNCAQAGSEFLSVIARGRTITLELQQNTIASGTLLHAPTPLFVIATSNIFDVESVHHRDDRAPPRPLEEVLRWQDSRNLFAVRGPFAHFGPLSQPAPSQLEVSTFESWKAVLNIAPDTSFVTALGLFARLQNPAVLADEPIPVNFRLTEQERALLKKPEEVRPAELGADLTLVGAQVYDRWRRSQRYQEWLKLARQQGFSL